MDGYEGIELFVGESRRASKSRDVFSDILSEIELHAAGGLIAVACPEHSAEVQILYAELGSKPVQIPKGEGSPGQKAEALLDEIERLESTIVESQESLDQWTEKNGRNLVAAEEYLSRESAIHTAPTLVAVSNQAFALDGWVPSDQASSVESALSKLASHAD